MPRSGLRLGLRQVPPIGIGRVAIIFTSMQEPSPSPPPARPTAPRPDLEQLLDDVVTLSNDATGAGQFPQRLLSLLVPRLKVTRGRLWLQDAGDAAPRCIAENARDGSPVRDSFTPAHAVAIADVIQRGQATADAIADTASAPGLPASSSPVRFLHPWSIGPERSGVLEIVCDTRESLPTSHLSSFLQACTEAITHFYQVHQLSLYREERKRFAEQLAFAIQTHRATELAEWSYRLVNAFRQFASVDRVTLLQVQKRQCRILATSGVSSIDRHSDTIKHLEQLAAYVANRSEPIWFDGRSDGEMDSEDRQAIETYRDHSTTQTLVVVPLHATRSDDDLDVPRPTQLDEPIGVMIVDRFAGPLDDALRSNVELLVPAICQAMTNLWEQERIPLYRSLRRLARSGWVDRVRRRQRLGLVAIGLATTAAFCFLPADLKIRTSGVLQPQQLAFVYAPADGIIEALHVAHGKAVDADQLLLTMRRPDLELQMKQVQGQLLTIQQRIASLEAERTQLTRQTQEERLRFGALTAEQQELGEQLRGLEAQSALLQQQQTELTLRSPQAGTILTWNPQERLTARPVARGQKLLTIGDLAGAWNLELKLSDRAAASVQRAQRQFSPTRDVEFTLTSEPGQTRRATLTQLSLRTQSADDRSTYVLATAGVAADRPLSAVAGTQVTATIDCGRTSLGYAWFHDLIDAIHAWWSI